MVETITLSIPAVDVLGEQLNLNVRQYPLEIPRHQGPPEDWERVARGVAAELAAAGLAHDGTPEPEVEDALYLLCGSEVCVSVAGLLDVRTGARLAARVVATGEVGVVGVLDGRGLSMHFLAPDELPRACVELLPDAPVGTSAGAATVGRPSDREDEAAFRAIEAITGRPTFRVGHFVVSGTGRRGQRSRVPGLGWFDNDQGRYLLRGEPQSPGPPALTCEPADKPRLAEEIARMLELVRPE